MTLDILFTSDSLSIFTQNESNVKLLKKIPLLFYFDKYTETFHFSENYKAFCMNNFNNFFDRFTFYLANDKAFITSENEMSGNDIFDIIFDTSIPDFDKLNIIYSNGIDNNAQTKFQQYISNKFSITPQIFFLSESSTKYLVLSQYINSAIDNIHIIFAEENKLFVSKNSFSNNTFKTESVNELKTKNFSTFTTALAKEILSNIQRIYNQKLTAEEITDTLEFLMIKLKDKEEAIKQKQEKYIVFSTKIPGSKENFIVRIEKEKINILQKTENKKLIAELCEKLNIEKTDKIGIIDNIDLSLYNELSENFSSCYLIEAEKIMTTKEVNVAEIMNENTTTFEKNIVDSNAEKAEKIKIDEIEIGWQIQLNNFDERPGKGASMQKLEFLGDKKFVVIESTRSLRTGDIAEAIEDDWTTGMQVSFNIYRGGKIYGRFNTRKIKEIDIIKEKN